MRIVSLLFSWIVVTGLFAGAVFSQTGGPPPNTPGKIGLINISSFAEEKAGITKYKAGLASVDKGLEPVNTELKGLTTRHNTAVSEYQAMQKATPPATAAALQAKADEIQTLETAIKRKQEDGKAQYNKLYSDIMSPIVNDIIKALNDFAKLKGYAVILDGAKLEQADILWGFDDRYDVTKEFILFYNARPAGTATTTKPN